MCISDQNFKLHENNIYPQDKDAKLIHIEIPKLHAEIIHKLPLPLNPPPCRLSRFFFLLILDIAFSGVDLRILLCRKKVKGGCLH